MAPPRWFRSLTDTLSVRRNVDPSPATPPKVEGFEAHASVGFHQPHPGAGQADRRRNAGTTTLPVELIGQVVQHLRHVEPSAASLLGPSPRLWPGPDFATLGALRLCARAVDAEVRAQVPEYGEFAASSFVRDIGAEIFRGRGRDATPPGRDLFERLPANILADLQRRRGLVLDYGRAGIDLEDYDGAPQIFAAARLYDAIRTMPTLDYLAVRNCYRFHDWQPAADILAAIGSKQVRVLDLTMYHPWPVTFPTSNPSRLEFNGRVRLEHLRLREFGTARPSAISDLGSLRSIDLEGTIASHWLDRVCRLPALEAMNLNRTYLWMLPDTLGGLRALRVLLLANNSLQALPPAIGELTQLTILRVDHNALTSLPQQLGNCRSLEHLDLGHNDIATLPHSLAQLTALRTVVLRANALTALPRVVDGWRRLEHLDAAENRIRTLPNASLELPALRALRLEGNVLPRRVKAALRSAKRSSHLELHL